MANSEIKDFFQNIFHDDSTFFDEGPIIYRPIAKGVITGSIDTTRVDPYRQGVELTRFKHFDAGMTKIHAGEPGHVLRKNRLGMDRSIRPEANFQDLDYFNPVKFLEGEAITGLTGEQILTFPIIIGDNDQIGNISLDGVIEFLAIRSVAGFHSIDTPFESHSVWGALMGSTVDSHRAAALVETVNEFDPQPQFIGYLDMVDMTNATPTNGFFQFSRSHLKPFIDARDPRNVVYTSRGTDMDTALALMSGSTDNYISFKQKSSTSGWDYDTVAGIGTDSLAFGGMTH